MNGRLRLVQLATAVLLFGALPLVAMYLIFQNALGEGKVTDFENAFHPAAEAILDGDSPYTSPDDPQLALGTEYVYPPLTALASIPFAAVSAEVAGVLVMGLFVAAAIATLYVLEIRDWRCYGLALLWPPVISAIQTGNITIPLALAAALVWRWRDHARAAGLGLGVTLAAKLFLWPLVLWFAATRRLAAVAIGLVAGAVILAVSWAVIAFAGVADYPDLLRRVQELEERNAYTVFAFALDLGASEGLARALWLAVGIVLVGGAVVLGRRGDDRGAFVLALAGALALSPIVWLHYFALLLVIVAVAEPRLGVAWFVPLAMYGSTGTLNGTTFQTGLTIAAAGATVALALRPLTWRREPLLAPTERYAQLP
jgi:hypothetical protein